LESVSQRFYAQLPPHPILQNSSFLRYKIESNRITFLLHFNFLLDPSYCLDSWLLPDQHFRRQLSSSLCVMAVSLHDIKAFPSPHPHTVRLTNQMFVFECVAFLNKFDVWGVTPSPLFCVHLRLVENLHDAMRDLTSRVGHQLFFKVIM
jgi:hypothetical protein